LTLGRLALLLIKTHAVLKQPENTVPEPPGVLLGGRTAVLLAGSVDTQHNLFGVHLVRSDKEFRWRNIMGFVLKAVGAGIVLMAVAAVVVVASPAAQDRSGVLLRSQLLAGPQIGVTVRDVDDADVSRESLPRLAGAVVEEVRSDSPAAEAGIKAGDVIVSFDSERVRSASHFARLVRETPEGRQVDLVVARDGAEIALNVTPEARPGLRAFNLEPLEELRALDLDELRELRNFEFEMPELHERFAVTVPQDRDFYSIIIGGRARLGVGVQNLGDQLAEYFGVTGGVLVTSVDEGTPAQSAGLRAGDVITAIDGDAVENSNGLRRLLNDVSGEVEVSIVRDRQEMTVTAELEAREPRTVQRIVR
jgi:serine protease Do